MENNKQHNQTVEKYCGNKNDNSFYNESISSQELLNRISTLSFDSTVERQQIFDLIEEKRLKGTITSEFMAHLAHSFSKHAINIHDESIRKSILHQALKLSKIALKTNENCALCHFSYGHIIGILLEKNQFLSKDKLYKASLFKYHMEKTIELDKNFYEAYAYLGRYEYIASNLNLFERKAASILGYNIEGNLDKALEYLHIALKGHYDMIHTVYLLIGKIYQKKKQYKEAKKYLNMCVHIPIQRQSQIDIVNEAKILLKDKNIENSSFIVMHIKHSLAR